MKKVFLTSDIGCYEEKKGLKKPTALNNVNNFVDNVKKYLTNNKKMVFIASVPSAYEINDHFAQLTFDGFKLSKIEFNEYHILDNRNKQDIQDILKNASLVFLAGGFTVGQMQFFEEIDLRTMLKDLDAVIIGQSAGAINLATNVYCAPEDVEEFNRPRIWKGLGLTEINIEPHFLKDEANFNQNDKLIRKELLKDSLERPIYAICDGSYIFDDGNKQIIYGESYFIKDGIISNPLCLDKEEYLINYRNRLTK